MVSKTVNTKHHQLVWIIALIVAVAAIAVLFNVPSADEGSSDAMAGNAFAVASMRECIGKPDNTVIEACPNARNMERYCKGGKVQQLRCVSTCMGVTPANAGLCAGDDAGLNAAANRVLVAACTAAKCEYTCNAGYEKRYGNGVCTPCQGTYGIAVGEGQGITGPVWNGNVSAINLRCEGTVFMNESSTSCGMFTLSKDCASMGAGWTCAILPPDQWGYSRAGCQMPPR